MKKFIVKQTGEEVKIGDTIVVRAMIKTTLGDLPACHIITLTKDNIKALIDGGIIITTKEVESEVPQVFNDRTTIDYYVEKIATKMGWHIDKTINYLNNIDSVYPAAAFSMILREIAIELDKQYEDHIEKSPEIYVISLLDGRITKVNKAAIKNYRNFAAFRTIEDAKMACRITKHILKDLYSNGK